MKQSICSAFSLSIVIFLILSQYAQPQEEQLRLLSDPQDHLLWLFARTVLRSSGQNIITSHLTVKIVNKQSDNSIGPFQNTLKALYNITTNDKSKAIFKTKLYTENKFIWPIDEAMHFMEVVPQPSVSWENLQDINVWWRTYTNGYIENLVNATDLNKKKSLLINMFLLNVTEPERFCTVHYDKYYKRPTEIKFLDYIQETNYFYYLDDSEILNTKILKINFASLQMNMYILLPYEKYGVKELIDYLEKDLLESIKPKMKKTYLQVTIPKFQYSSITNVNKILNKLWYNEEIINNLETMLILQCSGITISNPTVCYKNALLSQTYTETDEFIEFKANKPFVYFIESEYNSTLLLVGKFEEM